MLERFKVPQEDIVRVPEDSLRETVTSIFEKMGVSSEDAAEGANTLVSHCGYHLRDVHRQAGRIGVDRVLRHCVVYGKYAS